MTMYTASIYKKGEEHGIQAGIQTGIQTGIQQKALQVYNNCIARGFSEEDAIAISGVKIEDVPEVKKQ